jgi:hypothetical protein
MSPRVSGRWHRHSERNLADCERTSGIQCQALFRVDIPIVSILRQCKNIPQGKHIPSQTARGDKGLKNECALGLRLESWDASSALPRKLLRNHRMPYALILALGVAPTAQGLNW